MFTRISYTWDLMRASWAVFKRDRYLILFPLFSGVACLMVMASFVLPLLHVDFPAWEHSVGHMTPRQKIEGWAYLFAFYFANYFVITFFNAGIISCAACRMAGGEPSFGGGMRAAFQRIHLIVGWALVAATVGVLLKAVESSHKKAGRFIADILGAAWTIMTFLVVPVLVIENKGPIDAFKESMSLLKKTWGTQIIARFSFGAILFLLMIPGFVAMIVLERLIGSAAPGLGIVIFVLMIAYFVALALIQSALHSIFQAAVYMHTQGVQDETGAFPPNLLGGALG